MSLTSFIQRPEVKALLRQHVQLPRVTFPPCFRAGARDKDELISEFWKYFFLGQLQLYDGSIVSFLLEV